MLLTGESGTGKELLAAHIHAESPFAGGPFVKVNCAAIPTELIESELFGHEKGSFTGATSARRGKFELADGGTLFLDECGDLHASSQAKLLRVLQEGEFHRVGGEQPIRVSVRVIAATNRDLSEMVAQQKFREDLYYRLCVMPVRVPSLRERREDIRPLAEYFLAEFCARNNFRPKQFQPEAVEALEHYAWPGNIRELRNVVERMAILAPGDAIEAAAVPAEIRMNKSAGPRGNLRETQGIGRARAHPARLAGMRTGTSPARPARWGWNGPTCTNASGRWGSKGKTKSVETPRLAKRPPPPGTALLISTPGLSRSYGRFTFSAWRPLGPLLTSNSTSAPSSNVR